MENKVTLIIASAQTEERKTNIEKFLSMAECEVELVFISNNKKGLTEVYQNELEKATTDIVVFSHDDVVPLKKGWGKELIRLFTENPQYGILGVAGSKNYGLDRQIHWWYEKNQRIGMIFHGTEKKSWLTIFSPYNLKREIEEVAVIDGVFIACVKSRIQSGFDRDLEGFHFYDIDFCISNFGNKKCKIGVTNNICLRHESGGPTNESWVKNGNIVFQKHQNKLPLRVFEKCR